MDEFDEINLSKNTLLGAISTEYESMAFLSGTRSGFLWLALHEVGGDDVDAVGEHQTDQSYFFDDALHFLNGVLFEEQSAGPHRDGIL